MNSDHPHHTTPPHDQAAGPDEPTSFGGPRARQAAEASLGDTQIDQVVPAGVALAGRRTPTASGEAAPRRETAALLPSTPAGPGAAPRPEVCETIEAWVDPQLRQRFIEEQARAAREARAALVQREAISAHRAALVLARPPSTWQRFLARLRSWFGRAPAPAPLAPTVASAHVGPRVYGAKTTTRIASLVELKRR